jgi:polysaccharide pyruvyl transferase WcaK-like protein
MLMMSPFEWAAVFSRLSLVITERFHDTIFSLRHGVPVLTLDWDPARYRADGQSKTWCLLQQYGIEKTSHLRADASMDAADLVDAARRAEAGFDKQRIVQVNEVLRARFAAIMNRVRDALASG